MEIKVTERLAGTETALVEFAGKLGVANGELLDRALENLRTHGTKRVIVDLSRTDALYSVAAAVLVRHRGAFVKRGGDLLVAHVSANIREVLELLGLAKGRLPIARSVDEARRALEDSERKPS